LQHPQCKLKDYFNIYLTGARSKASKVSVFKTFELITQQAPG